MFVIYRRITIPEEGFTLGVETVEISIYIYNHQLLQEQLTSIDSEMALRNEPSIIYGFTFSMVAYSVTLNKRCDLHR